MENSQFTNSFLLFEFPILKKKKCGGQNHGALPTSENNE